MAQRDLSEKLRPLFTPMNLLPPTPADEACTRALEQFLDEHDPLETQEETAKRELVLVDLRNMTAEWVKFVLVQNGTAEEDAKPGQLFVSGSYRLGVAQRGADTDTILVVPAHVTRDDFFSEEEGSLIHRLRANPSVSHILPISTAAVPLIEVVWSGMELDVLFAGLNQSEVPDHPDDLLDDNLLLNVDYESMLSLNGPRVTEILIKLVPKYPTFCLILRGLRYWAKQRGIYSNKLGFLGGVNFAILATFACQLWPNDTASGGLRRLLNLVTEWKFPTPIKLCHSYDIEGAGEHFKSWDGQGNGKWDKMPIITPAFPSFNSSRSVTASTYKVMNREFWRGREVIRQVFSSGLQCRKEDWDQFFAPSDFFLRFGVYVCIVAKARDEFALKKWCGLVESKIRKFVELLEGHRLPFYEIFPFHKSFEMKSAAATTVEEGEEKPGRKWFVGLRVDHLMARARAINLEGAVVTFSNMVLKEALEEDENTLDMSILKFKDMVLCYPEFYEDMGVEQAFKQHKEITLVTQKAIEASHSSSSSSTTAVAQPGATLAASTTTTIASATPANVQSADNKRGARSSNHIDLTDLKMVPSKVQVTHTAGSRPKPIKIIVLE
ncbi:hypothetical protein BASA81_002932 [Batrachochytrium salamandrivorans]|nr:hypothetical protein BASA81_002932 [Batrachochytrium salamandrivorans]